MKAFLIGSLAIIVATPAFGGVPLTSGTTGKFAAPVRLNYTAAVRGGGGMGGYRGAYGYHGGAYHGGYGWHYPYYGYGWRYGYWGGYGYPYYWGYPYAAAFAFGLPLAYYAGYAAAYPPAYAYPAPAYYYRSTRVYYGSRRSSSSSGSSLVSNVQSSLKSRGYYAGGVDGNFGPESQHALMAFQTSSGLPATGTLDTPSLHALGVSLGKKTASATAKHPAAPVRASTTEGTFVAPPVAAPNPAPGVQSESPATTGPAAPAAPEPAVQPPPLQTAPSQ